MTRVWVVMRKTNIKNTVSVKIVGVYDTREGAHEASAIEAKSSNGLVRRIDIVSMNLTKKITPELIEKQKLKQKRKGEHAAMKERCRLAALNGEMENV